MLYRILSMMIKNQKFYEFKYIKNAFPPTSELHSIED